MKKEQLTFLGFTKEEQMYYLTKIFTNSPEELTKYGADFDEQYKNLVELFLSLDEKQFTEMFVLKLADENFINLESIDSTETKWLWEPYIPLGKITLLTADPGTGKTFFCLYLAAVVSSGRPFWGQTQHKEPRRVIYQTAEDGYSDTIKPRLEPMNPIFKNIIVIKEDKEQLNLFDERIENALKIYRPALFVFDPLQAYLGADVDMHRANEIRPILAHISRLAEKYECAIVFIMHNSKMGSNPALYRALGSIDIPAVARSMLIMANDPEDKTQKLICHEKSSLAGHGKTIKFHIAPEFGGLVFDGFSDLSADEILNTKAKTRDKPSVEKDEVKEQLIEILGDKGAAKLEDIEAMRELAGWSKPTLYRAKSDLQLKSVQIGFNPKITWWILPDVDVEKFKEWLKEKPSKQEDDNFLL